MKTDVKDWGLLLMRIGIGAMFVVYGFPKLVGGPEKWAEIGGAMSVIGVTVYPKVWGFLAALAECGGGVCLIFGLAFRFACLSMAFTMGIAAAMLLLKAKTGFLAASHALDMLIVFVGLLFTGAGRISLAEKLGVKVLK
jgi:putative oxidoreductase